MSMEDAPRFEVPRLFGQYLGVLDMGHSSRVLLLFYLAMIESCLWKDVRTSVMNHVFIKSDFGRQSDIVQKPGILALTNTKACVAPVQMAMPSYVSHATVAVRSAGFSPSCSLSSAISMIGAATCGHAARPTPRGSIRLVPFVGLTGMVLHMARILNDR